MQAEMQILHLLSSQVGDIMLGTAFLLFAIAAAGIAVIRRRTGFLFLFWLAIWSGMYGVRMLISSPAVVAIFQSSFVIIFAYVEVSINYLLVVSALLAWLELARDKLRFYLQIFIGIELSTGLVGIAWLVFAGSPDAFMPYNRFFAACTLIIVIVIVMSKKLSDRFLVLANRRVLAVGTLVFAAAALYANLSPFFNYKELSIVDPLGFAVLLFCLAIVAAQMIFANERRLISIENELETARKIQSSILPAAVPDLDKLKVITAYYPMDAVAGDFYDFVQIDRYHAGFLVADVSGHGVPAALIASMLKVALRAVAAWAKNPGDVMQRMGNILGNQLSGQFVSAAYLYLDSQTGQARYSAAGHPPLLYWDSLAGQARFIESNGLLFGVMRDTEYPVHELIFKSGDRFLLYTDGLTEAENAVGEPFGDHRLGEIIHSDGNATASELSARIFEELRLWQGPHSSRQDDITWIIIEVE